MCRIEEWTGDSPVMPVCQSLYTPADLVLRDGGELYKALVDSLPSAVISGGWAS
jgi:hypothetical protein